LDGVIVQQGIEDAQELLIGVKRDNVFGPVIVLGWGGIYVEILRQSVIRRVPIDRPAADAMIEELAGSAILRGARGRPPSDLGALAAALVAVSDLAMATGDRLAAIDVNPIMVRPAGQGAVAVDALIEMRSESAPETADA
jgi:acyl-CoA synthetase (NDP forming)